MLFPRDSHNMQAANDPPPHNQLTTPPRLSHAMTPPGLFPAMSPPFSLNCSQIPMYSSPELDLFNTTSIDALLETPNADQILARAPEQHMHTSNKEPWDWPLLEPGQQGSIGAARPDTAKYATLKGVNLRAQLFMLAQR